MRILLYQTSHAKDNDTIVYQFDSFDNLKTELQNIKRIMVQEYKGVTISNDQIESVEELNGRKKYVLSYRIDKNGFKLEYDYYVIAKD